MHIAMQSRSRDIGKILLVYGADKTRRNKVNPIVVYVVGNNGGSENSCMTKDTDTLKCFYESVIVSFMVV